jgi:hypothetical protein
MTHWLFRFCVAAYCCLPGELCAFGIYTTGSLNGGARWDAAPRTLGGFERSLDGGLRFSLQGGSFQAYRDLFSWQGGAPSVADFQQAVVGAFNAWTAVDSVSGLGTPLYFVPDLTTPVSGAIFGSVRAGAEIDLFGSTVGSTWNPGDGSTRGETFFSSISVPGNILLTSGTANYPGFAISGADITMNSNANAIYTLSAFRTILTHEIGHAIGLADVDTFSGPNGTFIDDNYDPANALATLTNSFALLINPFNPAASPLNLYTVADGNPGLDTPGVDILMESNIPASLFGVAVPLRNDDYAGRQFLYPVPEPGALALLGAALVALRCRDRRREPPARRAG